MIRSFNFWIGTLLLAIIPVLLIDVAHHKLDWTKDVHDEMIELAHNSATFTRSEKAQILDNIFDRDAVLTVQFYVKIFAAVVSLVVGIWFLRRYFKTAKNGALKPAMLMACVFVCLLSVKVYALPRLIFNDNIKIINYEGSSAGFKKFYDANFKGKVVYVDFWGVYCGPCLYEFQHFTQAVKLRYKDNKNIGFLYLCGGDEARHKYMWREQISKYNVEGQHIFLDDQEYFKLYRGLLADNNARIRNPRYMIIDKNGKVVVNDAPRPGERDTLYAQLDKYLKQ